MYRWTMGPRAFDEARGVGSNIEINHREAKVVRFSIKRC